jgi:hypothetical protein
MQNSTSHRNQVRQVIINKDGSKKVVFHTKKFGMPRYVDLKNLWKMGNTTANPNSKRQMKLAEQNKNAQALSAI